MDRVSRKPPSRSWFRLMILCLGVTGLLIAPAVADSDAPSMAKFIKIRWPIRGQLAPDGTFYYVHNLDGVYQLYVRKPGADDAQKLTDFEDGISRYELSDDGKWIVASAGKGGDEQDDLYLLNTATAKLEPLHVDRSTVFGSVLWRRDSKAFAYRANLESKSDFHIYIHDMETGESNRVLDRRGYWYPADFTRDGKKLTVGRYHSVSYSQLFEIDLASGDIREITPVDQQWSFSPAGYSGDEKSFLVTTDYQGDLTNLRRIDLATGKITPVAPELDSSEIDYAVFNEDRTILAIVVNDNGYAALKLRHMPESTPMQLPPMDKGLVGNIDFCNDQMLYSLNNANTPGIIYRWSPDAPESKPVAMTEADTQGIDVSKFTLPKLVTYKSFDKRLQIPAFLYTPKGHEEGKPIPFIVYFHGGPEGQYRPSFSRQFQYFLSRGFGIIAPNVRGSSGYGKKYLEMDNYRLRMDSVMDGVWAARYLVEEGYSKPGMIAAFGGSYGGFMTVATIAQAPKLFGAACDVVGIVNFRTFLQRTKAYRRKLREAEYGPLSDPTFLESISPIRLAPRIDTPILIAHGRNDPRVPVQEAEQLHEALEKLGRESELLIFEDEGHGFRKEDNRIEFYTKLADFFEEQLKAKSDDNAASQGTN